MTSHPDADAFVRAILYDPADVTTRLVFADWLEETEDRSNIAWARYIRLTAEASCYSPGSFERRNCEWQASRFSIDIKAKLKIPAALFVKGHTELRELLPTHLFVVTLAAFEIPRPVLEVMPESVARENRVLPLDAQGNDLITAIPDRSDWDWELIQKLQFILNRDIVIVRAEAEEIETAINRHYGQTETESVDCVFYEFPSVIEVELTTAVTDAENLPVARLVNRLIAEGIRVSADACELVPEPSSVRVRYRVEGGWVESWPLPSRLWPGIAARIANMAWLPADAVLRRRATLAGVIPLQIGNVNRSLRLSAGDRRGGILIEFDHPPTIFENSH